MTTDEPGKRSLPARILSALGPFLVLLALMVVLRLVVGEAFATANNLRLILTQTVIVAVGALGMTMIIVAGGIDLSCGSLIALSSVVAASVLERGDPAPLAIAAALGAGCVAGALNGAAIAGLRMLPFIVTL